MCVFKTGSPPTTRHQELVLRKYLAEESRENGAGYSADYVQLGRKASEFLQARQQPSPILVKFRAKQGRSAAKPSGGGSSSNSCGGGGSSGRVNSRSGNDDDGDDEPREVSGPPPKAAKTPARKDVAEARPREKSAAKKSPPRKKSPPPKAQRIEDMCEDDGSDTESSRSGGDDDEDGVKVLSGRSSAAKAAKAHPPTSRKGQVSSPLPTSSTFKSASSSSSSASRKDGSPSAAALTGKYSSFFNPSEKGVGAAHAKVVVGRGKKAEPVGRLGKRPLESLFSEALRSWAEVYAAQNGTNSYHILGETDILSMTRHVPQTTDNLKKMSCGWGLTKITKHGDALLKTIAAFLEQHQVVLVGDFEPHVAVEVLAVAPDSPGGASSYSADAGGGFGSGYGGGERQSDGSDFEDDPWG